MMTALLPVLAAGESPDPFARAELQDRTTDAAASAAFQTAEARLRKLAQSKQGTPEEVSILLKLADLQHKAAAIEFRLAGGKGELKSYKHWLSQSIAPLSRIIQVFPQSKEARTAIILRAKAYRETGNRVAASQDLRVVIDSRAKTPEATTAILTLSEIFVEDKQFEEAIRYLSKVEPKLTDAHYPVVYDRIAWANFQLGRHADAIRAVRRLLDVDRGTTSKSPAPVRIQAVDRERALSNLALFYASGLETGDAAFSVATAMSEFSRVAKPDELEKMVTQYAFLLRTKDRTSDLLEMRAASQRLGLPAGVSGEIALVILGSALNRRDYAAYRTGATELGALVTAARSEMLGDLARAARWQAAVQEQVATLQGFFTQAKARSAKSEETRTFALALISAYQLQLKIPERDAERVAKITFNLAEMCFDAGLYPAAATYYRWVSDKAKQPKELVASARVRSLAARYEDLKAQNLAAGEISARKIPAASESAQIPPSVSEWIGWVDDEAARNPSGELDAFVFEANRMLYRFGDVERALDRLIDFAKRKPTSSFAIPSASLALDTWVVSERWPLAYRAAIGFMKYEAWSGSEFALRVSGIAGDTAFKMIEELAAHSKHAEAIERADFYLKTFASHRFRSDCITLAANAALALGQPRRALAYLGNLPDEKLKPEQLAIALLVRGSTAEEDLRWSDASRAYLDYLKRVPASLKSGPESLAQVRLKAVSLGWAAGDDSWVLALRRDREACAGQWSEIEALCNRIAVWTSFKQGKLVGKATPDVAALFTLEALRAQQKSAAPQPVGPKAAAFTAAWAKLDPAIRVGARASAVSFWLERLRTLRPSAAKIAISRFDPVLLKRRMSAIDELQGKIDAFAGLPWPEVRFAALAEAAGLYGDYARELGKLNLGKLSDEERAVVESGLAEIRSTVQSKSDALRWKAIELAREEPVVASALEPVARGFVTAYPEAKSLSADERWEAKLSIRVPERLPAAMILDAEERGTPWSRPGEAPATDALRAFRSVWLSAYEAGDTHRLALLLQALQSSSIKRDPALMASLNALTLQRAGAYSEAWSAARDSVALAPYRALVYYQALNRKEVESSLARAFDADEGAFRALATAEPASALLDAAAWSEKTMPSRYARVLEGLGGALSARKPASNPEVSP